jgi:hypothetical protein
MMSGPCLQGCKELRDNPTKKRNNNTRLKKERRNTEDKTLHTQVLVNKVNKLPNSGMWINPVNQGIYAGRGAFVREEQFCSWDCRHPQSSVNRLYKTSTSLFVEVTVATRIQVCVGSSLLLIQLKVVKRLVASWQCRCRVPGPVASLSSLAILR